MILKKFYLSLFEKIFFLESKGRQDWAKSVPRSVCKWDVIAAARIFVFA